MKRGRAGRVAAALKQKPIADKAVQQAARAASALLVSRKPGHGHERERRGSVNQGQ